jgi:hypothetical protein
VKTIQNDAKLEAIIAPMERLVACQSSWPHGDSALRRVGDHRR